MTTRHDKAATTTAQNELLISRVFDAPQELVWKAWTEPERLAQWWGPKGWVMGRSTLDLRPGGVYHYSMSLPTGEVMWGRFVYRDIVPPERMVFVNSFSDERGGIVRFPLSPTWPLEVLNTLTLVERAGKTTVTLRGHPINATAEELQTFGVGITSMEGGFKGTFDQLDVYLAKIKAGKRGKKERRTTMTQQKQQNKTTIKAEPGKQEVSFTREFEAPRELVFRAFTDPAMYVQWLGPRDLKMRLETFDMRSGGSWRYIDIAPDGSEFGFHGVVHEVTAPERIIDTFEYEGLPEKGHVAIQTATFEALPGGRTKITGHVVFLSVADRDGMVQSGMEHGMAESHERLDELLAKVKRASK